MSRVGAFENRRCETRNYYPRVPLAWKSVNQGRWSDGWLNDASASGLSMLVPASPPRAGDEIKLLCKGLGQRAVCRVIRTEIHKGGWIMVACRVVYPNARRAWLRLSQNPRRARQRVLRRVALRRAV